MKLKQVKDNSNTLGVEKAREFTIDTSNQMIVSILRDRLYSNKIGAVCREVASNSRDANREAGRESKPIVIEIGNNQSILGEETLYISFLDSGIGISPERIDNVFLKYGSSTKRGNNNQTGGFGIGAKTPFAYNNEFIIETISEKSKTENVKHTYQAIILNQNGTESSQLILISEENTKEQTGTKIIVPLKSDYDRADFETEVFKATILWDVLPELKGFNSKYPKLDTLFSGDKWRVINGEYNEILGVCQNDFVISVDGILYTIKAGTTDAGKYPTLKEGIVRKSRESYHYDNYRTNVVLKFETGELTLSASREDVEMTDDNLKLIENSLAKMEKEILKKGEELLENKTTILSKTSFINNVISGSNDLNLKYLNGIKLFNHISSIEGLPKTYKDLFFTQNIYKIEDPSIDRVSLTKKNVLESVYITLDELKKCQIIFKNDYTRMNYRQSETLKRLNKPLLFVNISDDKLKRLTKAQEEATNVSARILNKKDCLEVLAEENINILKYEEVEKAKIVRTKSDSPSVKKDKNIKKIYVRLYSGYGWNKDKMDYNKSTKEIVEEEKDFSNTILLNMKDETYIDINKLDRTHISYERVIEQFANREDDDSKMNNFLSNTNKGNLLKTLKVCLGFNIMVIKHSDSEGLNKKPFLTLESAINKIAKDTKNRKFLKAILKESHFEGVTALHSNDSTYTEYSGKLGRAYLSLVDFNLDSYKVVNPNKTKLYSIKGNEALKDNELHSIWEKGYNYRDILREIAELVKDDFKMKMFEGYLTETILETQEEKMKEKYPTIHYVFNEAKGHSSWSFSEYDTKTNSRDIGQKILQKDLLKLIEQELKLKK